MGFLSSLFGIKGSQPKTSTVVQSQKLPEEISPFVKEILGEAKDLYQHEIERGYDPYTGETIAPLTEEEERAMTGIAGLAGITTPFLEEAVETYRTGAEKFTPEAAEEYMSPYQRAVTDIEKREAQRTFEKDVMPQFEAGAVRAGGMSGLGTRAGVEAAELQRGQSQLLADIEARGLQSAYQDARKGFEAQKARERQMAGDVGRIGPAMFQAGLAEQGALQTVGEQKRALGQSALDEAYYRFLEERQFPQKTLSDYSGMVYANPMAGLTTDTKTTTGTPFVPSTGQQLLGMGLSGLNVFGMGGGFTPGGFNPANIWQNKAEGGPVLSRQGGGSGEPRTIAEAKEMGKTYFINKDGKKLAAVTREDLERTGLSLGEYINKQNAFNKLMQSVTPGMKPAYDYGYGRSPGALGGYTGYGRSPGALGGRQERDLRIPQPDILSRLWGQYGPRRDDTSGGESTPNRVSPVSQQMDTRRDATARGVQEGQMKVGIGEDYFGAFLSPETLGVGTDPVTGGSFATIDDAAVDLYGFKHGGGLSQLANGGPVIKAQTGMSLQDRIAQVQQRYQKFPWFTGSAQGPTGRAKGATKRELEILQSLAKEDAAAMGGIGGPPKGYRPSQVRGGRGTINPPRGAYAPPAIKQDPIPATASPGRRIAQGGIGSLPKSVPTTTAPGGGVPGGGPLSVTDTVRQTIQSLGKDFLSGRGKNFSETVTEARTRIGGEEGFSKTKMTESFTDYQTSLKKLQKRMNAKNKAKRAEFNEADKKASEEFFAAQEKAIKAGNNADIIAGAMDTANQRQIKQGGGTIAQWLTDIMNVGVKGIGTRRKEQGKELRELAKEKYKESRTDRKTNRGEELAEINKESLQEAKNLVDKYGFSKELANMDRATRTAAYAEIAASTAFERGELTKVELMAKLLDVLGKSKGTKGKTIGHTQQLELIRKKAANDVAGYTYDVETGTLFEGTGANKTVVTSDMPGHKKWRDEVDRRMGAYLDEQEQTEIVIGLRQGLLSKGGSPQTSSAAPPKPSGHPNAKLGKDPQGKPGWYIPNPDPNSKDKFILVS